MISLYEKTKQCALNSISLLSFFFSQTIWSFAILVSENDGANINWVFRRLQNENFRNRTNKQIVLWIELDYSVFRQKSGQITANYHDKILLFFFFSEKWIQIVSLKFNNSFHLINKDYYSINDDHLPSRVNPIRQMTVS